MQTATRWQDTRSVTFCFSKEYRSHDSSCASWVGLQGRLQFYHTNVMHTHLAGQHWQIELCQDTEFVEMPRDAVAYVHVLPIYQAQMLTMHVSFSTKF